MEGEIGSAERPQGYAGLAKIMWPRVQGAIDPVLHQTKISLQLRSMVADDAEADPRGASDSTFPPQMRATLRRLLVGDSEKQIAHHLSRSPHTVHAYVKKLYRHYGVSSRAELLARWVRT